MNSLVASAVHHAFWGRDKEQDWTGRYLSKTDDNGYKRSNTYKVGQYAWFAYL